ncbi:uncharacterized protein LOC122248586 isoform X2 [Penaeus japonicus]|nr:uncharacterized protein LOC122248586 isoform X2 [Penaeus japonicus]
MRIPSLVCLAAALLACSAVSAFPSKKGGKTIALPFPDCAHYRVTWETSLPFVDLQTALSFAVLPSEKRMSVRIVAGVSQYTITVLPDKVLVSRCDGQDQNSHCTLLPSPHVPDILVLDDWTFVDFELDGRKIHVSIANVDIMDDDSWSAHQGQEGARSVQVSFLSLRDASLDISPDYALEVNLRCNTTHMPDQEVNTRRPVNTPPTDVSPAPYPSCPLSQVTSEEPLHYIDINSKLSLAVFPSVSMLIMKIRGGHTLYKASVEGTMITLMKCEEDGKTCKNVDSGGTKGMDLLIPNKWNYVDVLVEGDEITVTINHKVNVMGRTMFVHTSQDELPQLSVLASESSMPTTNRANYTIDVNVKCDENVTDQTDQRTGTKAPITDEEGAPVGIIVGVLVALLVIIAVAIAISVIRKRRTMEVNQHTPLQEQQQAQ